MHRFMLLTSTVAVASVLSGGTAFAQAATSSSASSTVLEEIIVTAERREQNIQDIPIAVSVISGNTLNERGVSDVRSLATIVPGLQVVEIGQSPSLFIRGVGSAVANVGQDPAASFNVDNVPIARPLAVNAAMFDLARVEVLKGPQGTLYGRNSTAGAINVISNKPKLDKYEGSVSVRYGNYNLVQGELVGNLPVANTFALRLGARYDKHDGYISNGSDDADSKAFRIRALWQPSENFSLLASATYTKVGGVGPGDVPLDNITGAYKYPNDPWRLDTNTLHPYYDGTIGNPQGTLAQRSTSVPADLQTQDMDGQNYTVEVNWDLGAVKLTAIPAYVKTNYKALTYNGGFRQDIDSHDKQTSLELRLASDYDNALQWIVGGFYMKDEQVANNRVHVGNLTGPGVTPVVPILTISYWPIDLTTYAAFGQGTYSLTDHLRFTLGVRYTKDKKETVNNSFVNTFPPGPAAIGSSDNSWGYTSYRAGIDFDLTANSLLYANISDAYKAGGVNQGLANGNAGPSSYDPEQITSYQVGSKNTFMDGRLVLNAEAWYWKWDKLQGFGFTCLNTGFGPGTTSPPAPATCPALTTSSTATRNFGNAHNYGLETEIAWHATDADLLTLNATYVIGRYDKVKGIDGAILNGLEITRTPKFGGVVGYSHDFVLGSGDRITAGARDKFSSSQVITAKSVTRAPVREDGYHQLSANLDYSQADGKWSIGLWGENLNNSDNTVFSGRTPAGLSGHPTAPRTYGLRTSINF